MECSYGCGSPASFFLKSGKGVCSRNVTQCPEIRRKNSESMRGRNPFANRSHHRYWVGKQGPMIGRTLSIEAREKIRRAATGRIVSEETRRKLSEHGKRNLAKRYADGWQPKAGRCRKIDYESPIAGHVKVDGTWELLVAQWLDHRGVQWTRNTQRFKYINTKGEQAHYTPDFYVEDEGYLEVKGYETDLDRCKWQQFQHPLRVLKRKEIEEIRHWKRGREADDVRLLSERSPDKGPQVRILSLPRYVKQDHVFLWVSS